VPVVVLRSLRADRGREVLPRCAEARRRYAAGERTPERVGALRQRHGPLPCCHRAGAAVALEPGVHVTVDGDVDMVEVEGGRETY
jgi:hypothetical protein